MSLIVQCSSEPRRARHTLANRADKGCAAASLVRSLRSSWWFASDFAVCERPGTELACAGIRL